MQNKLIINLVLVSSYSMKALNVDKFYQKYDKRKNLRQPKRQRQNTEFRDNSNAL